MDDFPSSVDRPRIFSELERLVTDILTKGLICELWVNGSFLTGKINPEPDDIDLSLAIHINDLEDREPDVIDFVINTLNGTRRYSSLLDTYICIVFPPEDPRRAASKESYWAEKWGVGWDDKLKGFAVIKFGENDVWFNLFAR